MKMRKILTTVLAGGILAGGLAGCSGGNTIKTKGEVKPEINYSSVSEGSYPSFEEGEAAKGYNEYAMKLFAIVAAAEDKNTNVMVSPASVMFALDLADSGACKNTLAEINKAIGGADLTPEQQQAFASKWMKSINSSEGVDFSVANAIWSNRELMGDNMSDEYKNYVKKLFDAEVRSMKFDGGAIKDINGWVNDKTKGMIDKILDELDPATAAVLVNAIAFIDQTKLENVPVEETVKPQLTEEDQRSQKARRLLQTVITLLSITSALLLAYVVYTLYQLLY